MMHSMAPIRRRSVFAPIGVCAVCTFLTLTTTARYGLAFSSPSLHQTFDGRHRIYNTLRPLFSRYESSDGDLYDRGQRRGRYSGESADNDDKGSNGRGGERGRRRSGGAYSDNDYTQGDSYDRGQRRGRYSEESTNSDGDRMGGERGRRRSGGRSSRDFSDNSDSYDRRQRRDRYSEASASSDNEGSYGRGGERGRRRSGGGGSRDFSDNEYDSNSGGNYDQNRDDEYYNEKGRNRYSSDGRKKERFPRGGRSGRGGRGRGRGRERGRPREQPQRERPPTPALDSKPIYFTCRHTYENSLRLELVRLLEVANMDEQLVSFQRPHPGLVLAMAQDEATASFLSGLRPTYALQVMPDSVVVEAESIKGLTKEIIEKLLSTQSDTGEASGLLRSELVLAPKGSLAIHSLVPEMGRGMPESQLPQYRRVTKIGEELGAQLKKRCRAARVANPDSDCESENENENAIAKEQWLLQILLLEPQIVAASFSNCVQQQQQRDSKEEATSVKSLPNWTWPNWNLPAGLALVDIEEEQRKASIQVPSSAYRKLLEAFWYMGERPPQASEFPVVDLGACPGGWTGALRLMGCNVVAVDRSPLDHSLMKDAGVEYFQGDAFRFVPPWARSENEPSSSWPGQNLEIPFPNTWMVSDIIAYPDKITELLDDWCSRNWVSHAIVTIKFQTEIFWEDIENATKIVEGHGYSCRTVHFFNNKNEVTFLAVKDGYSNSNISNKSKTTLLGKPMYSPILPKLKK